jgi:hypothetical protein
VLQSRSAAAIIPALVGRVPNMRLKLTGARVLKESIMSCPSGHGTFVHYCCAGGGVARSLSAIR